MKRFTTKFFSLVVALSLALGLIGQVFVPVEAVSTSIVISQVYGGAGCSTAGCSTYTRDYVEILNIGSTPFDLSGYSVQYASATGSFNGVVGLLSGTLAPLKLPVALAY